MISRSALESSASFSACANAISLAGVKSEPAAPDCFLSNSCSSPLLVADFLRFAARHARFHRQYRTRCVANYLFGNIADQQSLQPRASMGGKHDKVDPVILCGIDDFLKWITAIDEVANLG